MNLPISGGNAERINFHFLLEERSDGKIVGTIAELPDCQVSAMTQEDAIAELQRLTRDRVTKMTVVPFSMDVNIEAEQEENPWLEFMGMYKDDPIFAEIAAELRAERGLEHLGWVK
jgi:hypothetical protein